MSSITFVVLVGDREKYQRCFLSSPLFQGRHDFQILAQAGFQTSGQAYNDGIEGAENDLIVCVHQDVVLPAMWAERFRTKLEEVESLRARVGIVGCWGATSRGHLAGHVYHRDRELFPQHPLPAEVQTLDELLISFRKSSGLRFDPVLPSFYGYAVDLCLQAQMKGLQNFAIDAPCIHDTVDKIQTRKALYKTWMYLLRKWQRSLPVFTPTGTLDGRWSFSVDLIKEFVFQLTGYTPRRWWLDLPQVNREDILFSDRKEQERETQLKGVVPSGFCADDPTIKPK